jgi:DNA polymerase-3 subunit gamma/tau
MSYQVLARKWRPRTYEQVIGQDHITKTLKNSILKNKVAHAYLFTGTRGVGKTTVARIFAKSLMCQNKQDGFNPCLECESCKAIDQSSSIDYIEIDGASNNSVDNIRELIENVQYLPTSGKYKVYVIDEVHMLTVSAFNALLKTLEEPPAHVVFIFATTDPQKLLGTVLSRCQRFDFKSVSTSLLQEHLVKISEAEKFSFESNEVLRELCRQGRGSVRDTLSLLDQVLSLSTNDVVSEETLTLSLGLADSNLIINIIQAIFSGRTQDCIQAYKEVVRENVDFKKFVGQVLESVFYIIENIDNDGNIRGHFKIEKALLESLSLAELLWIYESLSKDFDWAINSFDPESNIELAILKVCLRRQILGEEKVKLNVSDDSKKKVNIEVTPVVKAEAVAEVENEVVVEEEVEKVLEVVAPKVKKSWGHFIESLFETKKTIAVNAERGNIVGDLPLEADEMHIRLGFSDENKIFYDYFQDMEVKRNFIEEIAKYFNKETDKINVNFDLLSEEEKEEKNFMSKVEIDQKDEAEKKQQQKDLLLQNKYIKEAEKLFNTKVNKVVLNDDN